MSAMLSRWSKLYQGTPAEHSLEPWIAALGFKYRFSHPVWAAWAFLDFGLWLPDERLIDVEVDGPEHRTPEGLLKDAARDKKLAALGWTTWRCTNEDALYRPERTVDRLARELGLYAQASQSVPEPTPQS